MALVCCAAGAFPASSGDPPSCKGKLVVGARAPTLVLSWMGEIADPMAECIRAEFDKAGATVWRVVLYLDSEGGYLSATERTIAVLRKIRRTHLLETVVSHGRKCWSACVPVFLAGERRSGALTSTWLFHEVGVWAKVGSRRYHTIDRPASDRVFDEYFLSAGVSKTWLNRLYLLIPHSDYWQTGQNLWEDKSGIITHPLDNLVPRNTSRPKY